MASLFYCGRLSSAQLVPLQAPKQRPIIDPHLVDQTAYRRDIKDNGYKSVFTNSWLVHQRNRSWINGLGKNPQKSELIHRRQCLLSGATEPCPLGLRETLACIHVIPHNVWVWVSQWSRGQSRLWSIPTNKKLEVWTQYRLLLSFLGGYFSSFQENWGKGRFVKKIKNPEIGKNPEKSQGLLVVMKFSTG